VAPRRRSAIGIRLPLFHVCQLGLIRPDRQVNPLDDAFRPSQRDKPRLRPGWAAGAVPSVPASGVPGSEAL
jgi:hypothetical protein